MTEQQNMLVEMVDRLFREMMSSGMPDPSINDVSDPLWSSIEDLGLCDIFLPEAEGGFDGSWQDAFIVFNLLGVHAIPLPLGETIVAKKLLIDAGIESPSGAITIGTCCDGVVVKNDSSGELQFNGTVKAVPWGAYSSHIVLALSQNGEDSLVLLATDDASSTIRYSNEAEESRCDIGFENTNILKHAIISLSTETLMSYGALLRSSQMAGALESALDLTVTYVNERVQFGRPLSKFQALQHQLALLAEEAAAVNCAAKAACLRAEVGEFSFEVAATKLRANRSVTKTTSIAHQTHGAIGFTMEHKLHFFTQRLWSWRNEFGNDRYWANFLGRRVIKEGKDNFWSNLTARSDL